MLAVAVEAQAGNSQNRKNDERQRDPHQPISSPLGGSAADRDALLPAQKRGFLLRFQIDKPRVVERLALGSLVLRNFVGKRIQIFLDRGGA